MVHLRILGAVLAGYSIYELLAQTGGVFSALATPTGYFEYFGRERLKAALGMWSLCTFAIPQIVLAALFAWGALRMLGSNAPTVAALLFGTLLSWFGYMIYVPAADGSLQLVSAAQFLHHFAAIYLQASWELPASWSTWLGVAAGTLLARSQMHRQPTLTKTEA